MFKVSRKVLCTAVLLAASIEASGSDKDEIISRCRKQMGEYGAAMVKACVDQDIAAVNALANYPKDVQPIIARCHSQMKEYGWAMVKACADQDIAAEEALEAY